jgi:proteasome lid subunit RPN8/RPN11
MTNSGADEDKAPKVEFDSATIEQIRHHARTSMEAEICGVLVGTAKDGLTRVQACIAGENADQGGAHVTFTQDTWQHIYRVKDIQFADSSIVGWYHSHPGFGIFLSDYDVFIHKNFFTAPHQIAWVFDPHSDCEGCFGWLSPDNLGPVSFSVLQGSSGNSDTAERVGELASDPDNVISSQHKKTNFFTQARRTLMAAARAFAVRRTGKRTAQPGKGMPKPKEPGDRDSNTSSGRESDTEKKSSPFSKAGFELKNHTIKGD